MGAEGDGRAAEPGFDQSRRLQGRGIERPAQHVGDPERDAEGVQHAHGLGILHVVLAAHHVVVGIAHAGRKGEVLAHVPHALGVDGKRLPLGLVVAVQVAAGGFDAVLHRTQRGVAEPGADRTGEDAFLVTGRLRQFTRRVGVHRLRRAGEEHERRIAWNCARGGEGED